MHTLKKITLRLMIIIFVLFVSALGIRLVNTNRYSDNAAPLPERQQLIAQIKGEAVDGNYLRAIHFPTDNITHPGTVVVFGGSEGSCNPELAKKLHAQGYDVLAAYFFGQEGQQTKLANVPLELFNDITTWLESRGKSQEPLTLIGGSKGAELVANLAVRYPEIDNIVLYSPAQYSYFSLANHDTMNTSSWTYAGTSVEYLTYSKVRTFTPTMITNFAKFIGESTFALPPRYRGTYEVLDQAAPNTQQARIRLEEFHGNALLFAGAHDTTWPSDTAAHAIEKYSPLFHAHVYENAGHIFFDRNHHITKKQQRMFGGTVEGNARAAELSDHTLFDTLEHWHH